MVDVAEAESADANPVVLRSFRIIWATESARAGSAKEQLRAALVQRRAVFADYIRDAFDEATGEMRARLSVILEEENELRGKQEEIIARLEPKLADLAELAGRAAETAQANAPNEVEVTA